MSRLDRFVAVDFAPPRRPGRPYARVTAGIVVVLLVGTLVVGVTQLLLR